MIYNLGSEIKNAREKAGLTRTQLAKAVFVSESTIAGYETGKHSPSVEILFYIAKALCVSMDSMVGIDEGGNA